ncbi:uncharacterized protein BP01DRAFT_382074 [Aspergillus saccharolyticus JOP 1030-1]|uniref:Uncharacterized protein n=1 Tax=Aspergillus saccharolyticus JOP 1030-1 TaxID=1450539 RepID=A0A319AGY8_9EURO|nr:hypothetical protein BP01DRAFT_382074 [Aspergillus saccharolyticus JOP 1030-1]PYH45892.1 hypothetical protein BP01DRAFT_382074 [Aspergillus saccharolyticus JOP 1030-1]
MASTFKSKRPVRGLEDICERLRWSIDYLSENSLSCYSRTCQGKHGATFRELLKRCIVSGLGPEAYRVVEPTDPHIPNSLESAICSGDDFNIDHYLYEEGVDVWEVDSHGVSLLHLAAAAGNTNVIRKLLRLGVNPTVHIGPRHDRLSVIDCLNPMLPELDRGIKMLLEERCVFFTDRIFVALLRTSGFQELFKRASENGTDLLRSPCDTATRKERYFLLVRHAPSIEVFRFMHLHVAKLDWEANEASQMIREALLCRKPEFARFMIQNEFPIVVRCTFGLPEVEEAVALGYVSVLEDLFARHELRGYRNKEMILNRCKARNQELRGRMDSV